MTDPTAHDQTFWQALIALFVGSGALAAGGRGLMKVGKLETRMDNIVASCPAQHDPLAARISDLEELEAKNADTRVLIARIDERVVEHGKKLDVILDRLP